MLRLAAITALFSLIFSLPAPAMWMQPDQEGVPLDRLVENMNTYLEKHPEDMEARQTLARMYSLAYARDTEKFDAFSPDTAEGYLRIFDTGGMPQPVNGEVSQGRAGCLAEAIRNYRLVSGKKGDDARCLLGLGYVYFEAAKVFPKTDWPAANDPFDKEAQTEGKNPEYWEAKALEAYRGAFALDKSREGGGIHASVAEEAGAGILKILKKKPAPTDAEQREMRKIKRALSIMAMAPRAVTPVVFSLENTPLTGLLAPDRRVSFDLDGTTRPMRWTWVSRNAWILAWDPGGTGVITSGRQLFGGVTWWMFWKNGYKALAALDDNGNGWLEGRELDGIAAWRDGNGNGLSDPGEVRPVRALGVTGINTIQSGMEQGMPCSARGIRLADGGSVATYDWISDGVPAK